MNISALLGALKKNESDGKSRTSDLFGGGEPIAAKVSVLKAKPIAEIDSDPSDDKPGMFDDPSDDMPEDMMGGDDEQDEAEDEDQIKDAKISAILQVRFPEIYKQIEAQLESDDSSGMESDDGGAQS